MIVLPLFKRFSVKNYELFPGTPESEGINFTFQKGVTLIAGINGLGKTTLLTILLRLLTGPADLSGTGLPPQIDSTLPEQPVPLRPAALRFFGQRVSDDARTATGTLDLSFNNSEVRITRNLRNLSLLELKVDGRLVDAQRLEDKFQETLCRLMNLSSFVDVLMLLHFIVFFPERRPGSLWDLNAQRQLLRAVFLPKKDAARMAALERNVGSADSLARNLGYALSTQETRLEDAKALHAAAPGLRAQLRSTQALLDADLAKRQAIEAARTEQDDARHKARLEYERAKIEREEAERAIERMKLGTLTRLFPNMEDSAKLTILTLLSKGDCLVCGSHNDHARLEIEDKLQKGICPICSSPPELQEKIAKVHQVEAARITAAKRRARLAASEETAQGKRWDEISVAYSATIIELQHITNRIDDLQITIRGIAAELPTPSHEIRELERSVAQLRKDVGEARARRAEASEHLRKLLVTKNKIVIRSANGLIRKFSKYSRALLSEETKLARIEGKAGIAQAAEQFAVPLFRVDMEAAARPGLTSRFSPQDVSESQRELIDLAFRFALIEVAASGSDSTFVMETPEASLDGIAMERVGRALHSYAISRRNRLVATSNLSNAGIVGFLFGGASKSRSELKDRYARTINLLSVSAKNHALLNDKRGKYAALLNQALEGK
jgi:energy-coupling factor transporter ATP-binding protein EcfA2